MPFLIFLFLLLLFFPYLFLPILAFFLIGFIFLLPYVFVFQSLFNIVTIPWQLLKIATDKRVRKNHSLEHATINVLEERYGRTLRIGGLAYSDGFSISGPDLPPPYEVLDAAREALFRMKNGESQLAIHPRCGTSMAGANFLFSAVFILVLVFYDHLSIINILLAFLVSNMLAIPFGKVLQKFFTTYPDVRDLMIVDIYGRGFIFGFPFENFFNPNRTYYVRTEFESGQFRLLL